MTPRLVAESARLAGQPLLRCQSDRRLVDLVRAGNDRAFEAIVDRYRPPLLRYCRRLLPPARAEDAVQQAFLNAYTAMGRGDADLDLRPWLYRIARNACLNALRETGWSHEQIEDLRRGTESAHEAFERQVELREIVAAVHTLPKRQRDAVVLRELEGRSYDEIAEALDASDGAVRQLLNRARNTLRAGVSAITPTALLVRLATPRAHRVAVQVSEAAGQEGVRATAARVAGLVAASLLLFGGISQAPHLPSGAGELSPGDSRLTLLTEAPGSARDRSSAVDGLGGSIPMPPAAVPRAEAGEEPTIAAPVEVAARAASPAASSRLPACGCYWAARSNAAERGGDRPPRATLSAMAASIVGAALHVLGRHADTPLVQAVEHRPVARRPASGRDAPPAVPGTVDAAATVIVTAPPAARDREDPAQAEVESGWDHADAQLPREDVGQVHAGSGSAEPGPARGDERPAPVDLVEQREKGRDDDDRQRDSGDDRRKDPDDDGSDGVLGHLGIDGG